MQPPALLAHTSKLVQLAAERRAGRLRIKPMAITAMAETVTTEDRARIDTAFGVALICGRGRLRGSTITRRGRP